MSKNLVIVESPAKARTIEKYLGPEFSVMASYGHVRDLKPKEGAVDPEQGFRMSYQPIDKNERHVEAIEKALRKSDALYLATDPDREGEAISWHLYEMLRADGVLDDKPVHRVVFHEITKQAVNDAIEEPRGLSAELVNAQQARRALDYLVGFNLSPLLWRKIRPGLSAGRVQSAALRLIVEREQEIEAFVPQEYWTLDAEAAKGGETFKGRLNYLHGEKVEQFSLTSEAQAMEAREAIGQSAGEAPVEDGIGTLRVTTIERKQRRRNPAPPFTTSTLQQEAARKLGFTASRTMRIAQQLYEGVELGSEGSAGLITYMRTDSVNLAGEAIGEIREAIGERYGRDMLPDSPRTYRTSSKNAQEAHEAIRPTMASRDPESLRRFLKPEQLKLYDLIWKRTLACQMKPALINTVGVDLDAGNSHWFRATGSQIAEPGFMTVYREGTDDPSAKEDEDRMLPPLEEGEEITLKALLPEQHFTEPPPRYSEASLVKTLEEYGIGRPSTYASIISTLQTREYVTLEKKRFHPTDVGRVVNRFLTEHFQQYVDYDFTARLEDELDAIARGEKDWVPVLEGFWTPFKELVDEKAENVRKRDVTQEDLDEACPKCGNKLAVRLGRRGRFIGCTGYPECDYTRNVDSAQGEEDAGPETLEGRSCPDCGGDLVIRRGRYGKFIGCSNYPKCRHLEPLEKPEDTGIACPECQQGNLLKRRSRNGKTFFSCSTYPSCKYAVWNPPLNEPCPKCSWPILTLKTTKKRGTEKVCPQKGCDYAEAVEEAVSGAE